MNVDSTERKKQLIDCEMISDALVRHGLNILSNFIEFHRASNSNRPYSVQRPAFLASNKPSLSSISSEWLNFTPVLTCFSTSTIREAPIHSTHFR